MKDLRVMKNDDLRDVAREYCITGAWKMTKDQLVESILRNAELNGHTDRYFDSATQVEEVEAEEVTAYEIDNPDNGEVTANEVDNEEEEEEPKEVKRPSLRINEIEFDGKTQSLRAWAEELEMPWPTLYDRINRNGWTIEEALTIPLGGRRKKKA